MRVYTLTSPRKMRLVGWLSFLLGLLLLFTVVKVRSSPLPSAVHSAKLSQTPAANLVDAQQPHVEKVIREALNLALPFAQERIAIEDGEDIPPSQEQWAKRMNFVLNSTAWSPWVETALQRMSKKQKTQVAAPDGPDIRLVLADYYAGLLFGGLALPSLTANRAASNWLVQKVKSAQELMPYLSQPATFRIFKKQQVKKCIWQSDCEQPALAYHVEFYPELYTNKRENAEAGGDTFAVFYFTFSQELGQYVLAEIEAREKTSQAQIILLMDTALQSFLYSSLARFQEDYRNRFPTRLAWVSDFNQRGKNIQLAEEDR